MAGGVSFFVRLVDQFTGVANRIAPAAARIGRAFTDLGRNAGGAHKNVDKLLNRLAASSFATGGINRIANGLGRTLRQVTTQTAEFDDNLQGIAQTAGISDERLKALRATILDLAPGLGRKPDDIASVLGTLVAAGIDDTTSERLLGPIGRVAVATRSSLGDIANTAVALTKNLKIPVEEVIATFDGLAAAGKLGRFELKDQAQYLPRVAAFYANLGQKGKAAAIELAAALQITRDAAGSPSEAANILTNLLSKIESPETVRKFKKLGVDLKAALATAATEGKSPLVAIIEETQKLLAADPTLKVSDLFSDMQVQQSLGSLIRNYQEFIRIRDAATKSQGVIDADFAAQSQTTKAALDQLNASSQSLARTWGDFLAPAAATLARGLAAIASGLRSFMKEYPTLALIASYGAGAFVAVASGLAHLSSAIIGLVGAIALVKLTGVGGILGGLLGWLLVPFRFLAGAITGFFGGLFGSILPAILRFGIGTIVRGLIIGIGAAIVGAIGLIPALIIGALVGLGALAYVFRDKLAAAFESVKGFVAQIASSVQSWFQNIDLASIGSAIMNSLLSGLQAAGERVVSWVSGFVGRLKSLFNFKASPTIAPNVQGLTDGPVIPQSAPGPGLAPRTNQRAGVTQYNSIAVNGNDPERAAREVVTALDRFRQSGMYDGAPA